MMMRFLLFVVDLEGNLKFHGVIEISEMLSLELLFMYTLYSLSQELYHLHLIQTRVFIFHHQHE